MSDERDAADDVGGADDTDEAPVSSWKPGDDAPAAPVRPTGKRSRQRAATAVVDESEVEADDDEGAGATKTVTKKQPKTRAKKAKTGPSRNPIMFVINYLKQVVAELRKVIWPNRNQMVTYTAVVLVFLVFMTALISLTDLGLAQLVLKVFG